MTEVQCIDGHATVISEAAASLGAAFSRYDYRKYLASYTEDYTSQLSRDVCEKTTDKRFVLRDGQALRGLACRRPLAWDSTHLDVETSAVSYLWGRSQTDTATVLRRLLMDAQEQGCGLISARLAADDYIGLSTLQDCGFRIVDTMNVYLWERSRTQQQPAACDALFTTGSVAANHATQLRDLAARELQHSRVYNDPHIDRDHAAAFCQALCDSILRKPGNTIIVAAEDDRPLGFVAGCADSLFEHLPAHTIGCLWLIAVDSGSQGRGIGRALLSAFLEDLGQQTPLIEVATQSHNYAANNLYASCGLKQVSALVTLHKWL